MNENKIRVRFAPSPTGSLHVGNARTALFNWLFARHHGGKFILRIEDTDQERSLPEHTESLLRDLAWLGIDWDEGPEVGGDYGPYNQVARREIYARYVEILATKGKIYECYCTEAELEAERSLLVSTHQPPRYSGRCRDLTASQKRERESQGRKPAWRFRVDGNDVAFDDLILEEMRFPVHAIGDFIIMRSNGIPAYNFAVVIDDALMRISHVIRGNDHLSNTALQMLLYRELGFEPPRFAHHSLVLGKDRAKLSKRHGAVAIGEFRRLGFLPEALVNYLGLCGASAGEGGEIRSREEMIALFSLDNVGKSGAVFDADKLGWVNTQYIRNQDVKVLAALLRPLAAEVFVEDCPGEEWLEEFCACFRENFTTLPEARPYLEVFCDARFRLGAAAREVLGSSDAQLLLGTLRFILERATAEATYGEIIAELKRATGHKGKRLFLPLRAALTGAVEGMELEKLFSLLPRNSMLFRLHKAMSWG